LSWNDIGAGTYNVEESTDLKTWTLRTQVNGTSLTIPIVPGELSRYFRVVATGGYFSDVVLTWDINPDPSVAYYTVYWGTASKTYTFSEQVLTPPVTITGLIQGVTYYFAVTDSTAVGLESNYSTELVYTVPIPEIHLTVQVGGDGGAAPNVGVTRPAPPKGPQATPKFVLHPPKDCGKG
jgi:hypothetical protein